MSGLSAEVEQVLSDHAAVRIVYVDVPRRPGLRQLTYVCTCGVRLAPAVTKGQAHRSHVSNAVEAIVARAVNEALTEAADAIEAHRDDLYVEEGIDLVTRSIYADAAEMVRHRRT